MRDTAVVNTQTHNLAQPDATHLTLVCFWGCACKSCVLILQITQQPNKNHKPTLAHPGAEIPQPIFAEWTHFIDKRNKHYHPLWRMICRCWEENIKAICSGSKFGAKPRWCSLFWPILALLFSSAPEIVCCAQRAFSAGLTCIQVWKHWGCLHFMSLCH